MITEAYGKLCRKTRDFLLIPFLIEVNHTSSIQNNKITSLPYKKVLICHSVIAENIRV
jgi:hypothetical protein